jgi:hypothetical protein
MTLCIVTFSIDAIFMKVIILSAIVPHVIVPNAIVPNAVAPFLGRGKIQVFFNVDCLSFYEISC